MIFFIILLFFNIENTNILIKLKKDLGWGRPGLMPDRARSDKIK